MPAKKRLTMRQLRALLRLKHGGARLSDRTIACRIGVARSTIQEYLARVEAAGLSWSLPDDVTDEALERRLFPRSGCRPGFRRWVEPDRMSLLLINKKVSACFWVAPHYKIDT
jgi:hypothetical protein